MHALPSSLPTRNIVRLIGAGGMGAVYEAWDPQLERRVALKMLHPHLTMEESNKSRLLREARLAARLEHQSVVRVYGVHEHEGGLALEMQFVEGTPLNRLLEMRTLTPVQAADLLRQTLDALAVCHAQGIVHSDLKPGNLIITAEGKVMLTDFGIARAFQVGGDAPSRTTVSGPLWGTPQYCPPEAWEGALPAPNWDLYALGVLVHEGLTGDLPFRAETPAVLMREKLDRVHDPIRTRRSDLSGPLAGLIDDLKAPEPEARPASADVALSRLRDTPEYVHPVSTKPFHHVVEPRSEDQSVGNPTVSLRFAAAPPRRNRWTHAIWLAVLVACVGTALAAQWYFTRDEPTPAAAVIPPVGKPGEILELVAAGDFAYFSYDDGRRGRELWRATPDGKVELVADINVGPEPSNPGRIVARSSGAFVFAASTTDQGEELWFCQGGIVPDVRLVRDIAPGAMSSQPIPVGAWDQSFLFYATSLQYGTELWITNSNEKQTGVVKDLAPGGGNSTPRPLRALVDESGLYTVAQSEGNWCLFHCDPSSGDFESIAKVAEYVGDMIVLNGHLFMAFEDPKHGMELWVHRVGEYGIHLFMDIWPGPQSSEPRDFVVWNDFIFFQANHPDLGSELWCTDGTPEGTRLVMNIAHGAMPASPYGFVATPQRLFFRATSSEYGNELWATDGSAEGTRLVFDLVPGPSSSTPYNLVPIGPFLFFSANDLMHGEELWAVRPDNLDEPPLLVGDFIPGSESSEPHGLVATGPESGVFIHKGPNGDELKRLIVENDSIRIESFSGLRRKT